MSIEKKRIYILVKTYPTISDKYAELVCTAGIQEDGSWIRLYPIPFRKLDSDSKYKKFSWIEVEAEKNTADFRPETYRPTISTLKVIDPSIEGKVDWTKRRKTIFSNTPIYTNLDKLISKAKDSNDGTSLAIFKPTKIKNFIIEPAAREWDSKKLAALTQKSNQYSLLHTPEEIEEEFRVVPKVPYKFSYKFVDDAGRESTLMIEDWEIGMLYFNCLKRANGDESIAVEKVKQKYLQEFAQKDIHFFLGTTKQFHNVGHNPFIIIGVIAPPHITQGSLLDFL